MTRPSGAASMTSSRLHPALCPAPPSQTTNVRLRSRQDCAPAPTPQPGSLLFAFDSLSRLTLPHTGGATRTYLRPQTNLRDNTPAGPPHDQAELNA